MNSLYANIRNNTTKGQLNDLRKSGNVPAIIYGGEEVNQKIYISKKLLKNLLEKENFLSNIITINLDGKSQNVLPREIKYDILSDEPTHVDFLRVLPGVKINSTVKSTGQTGVEMEALTATSVAALTIYDMLKAADKTMELGGIKVLLKDGGKSGRYEAL